MDVALNVYRILTGFEKQYATLEQTIAALRACADDVPLGRRQEFFTQLLLQEYRAAVESTAVRRVIPILHAWASFGPAEALPEYIYAMRGFERSVVEEWIQDVLPVFRFALSEHAGRFSDSSLERILNDCQMLSKPEPLLAQPSVAEASLKNVEALAETVSSIRHQRYLRTIKNPYEEPRIKERDDLLPLFRRRIFDEDLEREVKTATVSAPLTVLLLDLDKFKVINDTYGHQIGDAVLMASAQILQNIVGQKGSAYRYGGEEFIALLPNYTADEGLTLAERVRHAIATTSFTEKTLNVTVSIGIATAPSNSADPNEIVRLADEAMYTAKLNGRNSIRVAGK